MAIHKNTDANALKKLREQVKTGKQQKSTPTTNKNTESRTTSSAPAYSNKSDPEALKQLREKVAKEKNSVNTKTNTETTKVTPKTTKPINSTNTEAQLEALKNELSAKKIKYTDDYWQSVYDDAMARFRAEGRGDEPNTATRAWLAVDELRDAWEKEKEDLEKQIRRLSGIRDATWKDATIGSLKRGYEQSRFGEESYNKMMGNKSNADAINDILQDEEYQFEADGFLKEAVSGAAELIGQMGYLYTKPDTYMKVGSATLMGAGTAAAAGQMGPQIGLPEEIATVPAGALLGFKVGMGTVSAENALKVEAGHAYNEMIENGISHETARNIALGVGTVNATLEMLQVDELIDAFKILNKSGATSTVAERIFKELVDRGVDVAKETAQEVAQEGATMGGVEIAHRIDKGEGLYTSEEVKERLGDTAKSSALSFGMMNVPATAFNVATTPIKKANETKQQQYEQQKDRLDSIIEDEETLTELIDVAKKSGKVASKFAKELEQDKANGKITREQVGKLINITNSYYRTQPDSLEQAARDVVESRKLSGVDLLEARKHGEATEGILNALSKKNIPITKEEVKKVTGFEDNGSELITKYSNVEGATFSKVLSEVKASYTTGFKHPDLDIKKVAHTFTSQAQADAYTAGQKDGVMYAAKQNEGAKNIVVHQNPGFDATNIPSDVTKNQVKTLDLMANALGVKSFVKKGLEGNAEINRATGEVPIDFDFERIVGTKGKGQRVSIVFHAAHEMAVHRVVEAAPEEGRAFVYAMYDFLAGSEPSEYTLADKKRYQYAAQGVDISFAEAMEEVTANNILRLYNNDEAKFHKAIESIVNGTNEKAKTGLRKYIDYLNQMIRKILNFLSGKSKQEKSAYQAELDEITRLRDMFETAFAKAVENVKNNTNSTKNLEIKINEEYNGSTSHSLKWHTDLNRRQLAQVEKWIAQAGNPESTRITDTANWYKGRINGNDLFVIYSTEDSTGATILYERKGAEGKLELDILLKMLEDMENGRSIIEASKDIDPLLKGDWLREKHNLANSNAGLGGRGSNTGYAPILQRESSKFIGSQAFRNVIKNLLDIQAQAKQLKSYSLKEKDTEYLELAKNPEKNEARLRELVDEAAINSMPNSKITTEDGKLRIVYHGTNTGDFTVFNPDYIGMSSGDDGFFGMGFYFAYSEGEASYYGAKRIIPAYLNLKKPFNFDKELRTYKGKKAKSGHAPDAVAIMNFADKFPDIAKNITINVVEKDSDTYKELSLADFSKAFKDVIDNKKFEYQELTNEFGEKETLVSADPQIYEYEYNGKKHKYKDYGFQKRFWGKSNDLDVAYEYLANSVYSHIDMYNITRFILDNNKEFTNALKNMEYDGTIQSEFGDEAVAFYSEQIKSADLVTYDDDGNIIPLSERFNKENDDIRYSLKDSEYLEYAKNPEKNNAILRDMVYDAAIKSGIEYTGLHGTESFGHTTFDKKKAYGKTKAFYFTNKFRVAESYSGVKGVTRLTSKETKGNYEVALDIKKPLIIDCKGSYWNDIPYDIGTKGKVQTVDVVEYAKKKGYDGVIFKNLIDAGQNLSYADDLDIQTSDEAKAKWSSTVYAVFESSQIKSLDSVTYDNKGNVIPLSERFNKKKDDIRYSLKDSDADINKLSTEEKKAVDALGKGAKAITNKDGDMLIATNEKKNTIMYSRKTYENGGREALEKALRNNGHTEAEIRETLSYVDDAADYLTILAAGYAKSHNYTALSNHLIADVITNVKTGKQVISSIVNNGDYPVNIDLALICKKRVAYMNLMNRLIDDGIFDKVNYGGEAIAKVNELLREDGFETACLGCFVESRRLQFQTWAETIVSEWNAEVDKRTKNADSFNFAEGKAKLTDAEMDALAEELKNAGKKNAQGNLNLGQGSVQTKMGRLLDKVPSLRKHLTVADLLKPDGLTALRAYDSNLFSIVKSRYGAASPKIVQDYNPYASEIAMLTFSSVKNITTNAVKGATAYKNSVTKDMGGKPVKQQGETTKEFNARKAEFNAKVEDEAMRRYLYDIGGARIQSFSDFMIENVFDYIQIFADLSAKRLPLHGYTKEIVALRLFGMTGAKWNGSLIAHVDRDMGKEYAGLLPASEAKDGNAILVHTEDGDYAIGFDDYARYKASNKKTFIQSIGMKDIMALQLDPRYSSNVGSITIGVSDKQILAMLDSPLFRFIIPYHSSGMLPQFAKLVGVDLYNDYTDYQNTTVKQWYDAYGNPCEPIKNAQGEKLAVDTSYSFNAEVQKTGDAKKAANNYLKWCDKKHPVYDGKKLVGYVTFNPKFSNSPYGTDFTKHENYYKLLEDFNVYDNITEESAIQGAVTMTFPSEENRLTASEMDAYKARLRETGIFSEAEIEKYSKIADKTFKELIADEVKGRAEYQKAQAPKWEGSVDKIEKMLLADHKRTSNSLKGTTDIVTDEERRMSIPEKLAKYAEEGMISTEKYEELIEKYGFIPYGENPHRDIQVPKKTAKNKKVSQTVRTILEAEVTPDEALPTIEKMVEDGVFSYDVYTDKKAIADAEEYLQGYGWVESYNDWMKDVSSGIVSKQHTVMGWALYNNAVNTATTTTSESEKKTAMETAISILDAMVRHQRNAAQALQATRVLKKLSPESQLYGVQKSVNAFQKELTDKYGDKAPDLKIDEGLAEQFLKAKTDDERLKAEIEIYKDIGRQMPSTWMDKWNAWRYVAMLGNLRTHGRNIVGNAGFAPVVITKDLVATAIESAVYRISGKKTLRGKALIWGSKSDRALLKVAWDDYANVADIVSGGGKYNDSAIGNQYIQEGRQIFKSKLLEKARRGNSKLLEWEDVWFSKPHYAYALAQYCKANNISPEQIARGKAIDPAREYAIKEAQKATYKDTNAFSQMVSGWGRSNKNETNAIKKTFNTIIEGVLPFRKTPANILARGVEYSPIGLIKGLTYDLVQVGKGKISSTEAIDNISAGLTGTGLLALGVYLAAQGLVRGHGEDDEEKEFKELMGHQAYSLELPNGESITLDWLAPEALPFFVGVNLWESKEGSKDGVNLSTILQSVSRISEPMLEMSCLQGINDLLESVGFASSNDTSGLVSIVSSAVSSYLTQGIPTILGQAERTGEEERMTTYTEKDDFLTSDMQRTIGKASAKIPLWDYNQIPYIDAWGRKEASGTALKRGLNNFLNPAYTSTIDTSKMEEELLRVYEATGEGGVFPERADKYFTVDGKRKDLTADEYVRYATLKGEKSYEVVSDLVNSKAYKKLTDQEKAKAIKEAYDYANQKAKETISNYKPDTWVSKADEFGTNVGNYISFKTEVSSAKQENGGKISKNEIVDIILDMAENDAETWKMYLTEYESQGDMYAYNKGIGGEDYMDFLNALDRYDRPTESGKYGTYTQEEATRAVNSLKGLSRKEKAALWQSVNTKWKNNPF